MTIDSGANLCSLVFIKKGSVLLPAKAETFSIRLSDTLKREVDEIARLSRRSRSFVINEAVSAYVSGRADHLHQLDDAVSSAESGIGHSGGQIFAWLRTWGTNEEIASPSPDILPAK